MKSLEVINHSKYLILKLGLSILWLILAENSNIFALYLTLVVTIRVSVEGT